MRSSGLVDRPLRSGMLRIPREVWIEKDRLLYRLSDENRQTKQQEKRPAPALLQEFIELDEKEPEAFRNYAARWGVFGLCKHSLPHMHNWPTGTKGRGCVPQGFPEECWEPLSTWRNLVSRFLACLRIAASIHSGTKARPEDWERVVGHHMQGSPKKKQIGFFVSQVNNDLYLSRVNPTIAHQKGNFAIEIGSPGWVNLYGALTCQLALATCRTDGLAHCSACGRPFVITGRRPNPNRRSYCSACGLLAAQRDASRDYRKRKREEH